MKKIISIILILLLCGCNSKSIRNNEDYITPINDNLYELLNDDLKASFSNIYSKDELTNNLLEMIGEKITDLKVNDYYDQVIDFNDYKNGNVVFEVVQNTCQHCKKQAALSEVIVANEDITFIQYFAHGDKKQIDEFYKEANVKMNDKIIVIPESDELSQYISKLGVDQTPTFIFFKDGIINLACIGEVSHSRYLNIANIAFKQGLAKNDLISNDGVNVFDLYRDYDDVLNDLSTISKNKLALIDDSEELTVKQIGKPFRFNEFYDKEGEVLYSFDNYESYIDKPLVVFYLGNMNDNLKKDVSIINEFVSIHKDLNILTILMDNKDIQTSIEYKNLGLSLNTDVTSSNGELPRQFIDTSVISYPAVLFIQDNIINGGCHSFKSIETLKVAYDIFLNDTSIALKANN